MTISPELFDDDAYPKYEEADWGDDDEEYYGPGEDEEDDDCNT